MNVQVHPGGGPKNYPMSNYVDNRIDNNLIIYNSFIFVIHMCHRHCSSATEMPFKMVLDSLNDKSGNNLQLNDERAIYMTFNTEKLEEKIT